MTDPIADIIGDYRAFAALQRDRLAGARHRHRPVRAQPPGVPGARVGPVRPRPDAPRAPRDRQSRERLERPPDLLDRPRRAARRPRRPGRPAHRAHPARPPARLQDGAGAPRRRGRRHVRHVRRSPQARPDGTAVPGPEQHTRPRLHPVRGLHPREVLSTVTAGIRRARWWPVRGRVPPRRRLGAPAAGHGDRPQPAAADELAARRRRP